IKEIKEEIKETKKEEKKELSFLGKIKQKLTTSILTNEDFEELFQPIELTLIENNFAIKIVDKLKEKLKKELVNQPFKKKEAEEKTQEALKEVLRESIVEPFDLIEKIKENKDKPYVIVFFGINGAGKTTTIAKLAHRLKENNLSCVFAAADTFRAASIEQLQKHADKLDVKVIKQDYGADPAAVAFDAIKHAKANNLHVVLIDTAGRMHTKMDLMREMEKICRVAKPHSKIFVAEAITGSDLIEQLKKFNEAIGIDAAILTKADVDEKGGAMISVGEITGKPILYLGTGQEYKDLVRFEKEKILKTIFS
ncbi:signal recognition particle-docking protein FtsY, partial [Nanoarchaeota archaeon]